ncbi:uncharacterized protein LOC123003929 [Tribolium madens]|uniref:uncharacterized protein LOC123003929 n=1 Tax=Tribolium madens TaxID=41895 RepID=UPI001CF74D0A|nr:uncharacterized protein LOC123003929 [Tribolium madens]
MRSQRNLIPIPTKPVRSSPRPLARVPSQRKSSSSQTERVVLIKEENLTFYPCTRLGQNDGGMRRDYVKAVNYINSCHKFVNAIIEKNSGNKSGTFLLPMTTNFLPMFPYLIGKKPPKREEMKPVWKSIERKTAKKPPEPPLESQIPVGDCEEIPQIQEDKYASHVADIVKEQIHSFLNHLHEDMNKAVRKTKSETPKCKNLDIVKQRLEELSKICCLQKKIESNSQIGNRGIPPKPPSLPSPLRDHSDESVIMSDGESDEKVSQKMKITCYKESSEISDSSDIKSDSDLEAFL